MALRYAYEEDIYSEYKITEKIENIMFSLLFIDGFTTFFLVQVYGLEEKTFIINILHYFISSWFMAIIAWILIVIFTFRILRRLLAYKMRREYRAVVLVYIFNLLIAVLGNIFIMIKGVTYTLI